MKVTSSNSIFLQTRIIKKTERTARKRQKKDATSTKVWDSIMFVICSWVMDWVKARYNMIFGRNIAGMIKRNTCWNTIDDQGLKEIVFAPLSRLTGKKQIFIMDFMNISVLLLVLGLKIGSTELLKAIVQLF